MKNLLEGKEAYSKLNLSQLQIKEITPWDGLDKKPESS